MKKFPENLKTPTNEIQQLKEYIEIFMSLRYMTYHLKWRGGVDDFKTFPIKMEEREVYKWNDGHEVDLSNKNYQLVLCNKKVAGKLCVRYVVADPEFFILVEPKYVSNKMVIDRRVANKNVEVIIDRAETRNLIVGFKSYDEHGNS